MAGPEGAATVVIAQPDDAARELLARVVEAAGHIAVRVDASAPPDVVEATVEASANLLIVDLASVSRTELTAVIEALAVRRFPAQVMALADGPASGALAVAAGAAQFLARPFHQRDLTAMLTALLDPDQAAHANSTVEVERDAEPSSLSAVNRLPPIDEFPDLRAVDDEHVAADENAPADESTQAVSSRPEESSESVQPAPDAAGTPDESDQGDTPAKPDEPTPGTSSGGPTAAPDAFTDILKMGRQL